MGLLVGFDDLGVHNVGGFLVTYDLVVSHNVGSSGNVGRYPADPIPSADRVIREGVVINAGTSSLDVNLLATHILGSTTLDGAALPRTLPSAQVPGYTTTSLYLVSRDTGVRHLIAAPNYSYGTTSYSLQTDSDRIDANLAPGTYDLVISHNVGSSGNVGRYPADPIPSADRVLRACVLVP